MLKTPKSKDVITNLMTGVSLAGGAMASDGVVALIPAENRTVGKAAIAGGSFIGAAAIKGTSKTAKTIQLALIGMGVMQTVGLVREKMPQSLKQSGVGNVAKAINGTLGLGCACSGLGQIYPALMYPNTIKAIDYNREFVSGGQSFDYTDFEDVTSNMF